MLLVTARRSSGRLIPSIRFNSTVAATASATTTKSAKAEVASIAPTGTKLKGCNIKKNGEDPVALADGEYPEWLWSILDEKKTDPEKIMKDERRKVNRQKIKSGNFMASMKK